jgi:protein SCO1/2
VKFPRAIFFFAAAFLASSSADAGISPNAISEVAAVPRSGASLPLALSFRDGEGRVITLRQAISAKPALLMFADYTCSNLCGPTISLVSQALAESGLKGGKDFRLIVIGIDLKDTLADAKKMKKAQLSAALSPATLFLSGDEKSIRSATEALGYHYQYDPAHDQFAHSVDVYVLNPQGHVSRVLNGLAVNARDVRLAIVAASQGAVGTIRDHLQLICYGFDPAKGTYSVAVNRILFAACCMTALSLAGLILLLTFGQTKKA